NLGTFPGLVAAAALLTDYVLTVSVSVVAGVFAITSAIPSLHPHKVELSMAFVALITIANLRGVRESGTLFAIPTYGFIVSIYILVLIGLVRCLGASGCAQAIHPPARELLPTGALPAAGLFVVLHAFSSGSTALTAVILVLAANTSYQDFPRLASILARDRFLPRQFENRGDRLVFSNGVVVLALFASLLIVAFNANLDRLIQLYVVGVFTSFTLS